MTNVNEGSPPNAANDVWVLSDTVIPTGIITPTWFTQNDTDPNSDPLFVTAVAGLTADGVIGSTGLTANFEVIGGLNQLVDISGLAVTGNYTLSYTLSDDSATDTNNSVSPTVVTPHPVITSLMLLPFLLLALTTSLILTAKAVATPLPAI